MNYFIIFEFSATFASRTAFRDICAPKTKKATTLQS